MLDGLDLKSNPGRVHPLTLLANAVKLIADAELTVFCPVLHIWCPEAGMISSTVLYQLFRERLVFNVIILDGYSFIISLFVLLHVI